MKKWRKKRELGKEVLSINLSYQYAQEQYDAFLFHPSPSPPLLLPTSSFSSFSSSSSIFPVYYRDLKVQNCLGVSYHEEGTLPEILMIVRDKD
jgi:hypothetical protein